MSNLVHRKPNQDEKSGINSEPPTQKPSIPDPGAGSEEEMEPLPSVPSGEEIPQDKANIVVAHQECAGA